MKRHANTIFQRQRAEFESSNERSLPQPDRRFDVPVVEVKDGYDWLQVIKQTSSHGASAH